jgi:hypothetical protein
MKICDFSDGGVNSDDFLRNRFIFFFFTAMEDMQIALE